MASTTAYDIFWGTGLVSSVISSYNHPSTLVRLRSNGRRADCRASPAWCINLRSDATMVESAFAFGSRRGDLKGSNGILSTDGSCGLQITLSIWRMASSVSELSLAAPPIEYFCLSWNTLLASYQLVKNSENFFCIRSVNITTMD